MKRLLFVCTFIFAAAATFAVDIGTALDQAAEQFSSTLSHPVQKKCLNIC